jgi:glycosyltransferase involved in cell wall biosynthesis
MKIIFWENIVSQHKLPYWHYLAESDRVTKLILVVEEVLSEDLKAQGWGLDIKKSPKFELIINPNQEDIKSIIEENTENSYHIFSGIRANPMVYSAFLLSKNYNINRLLLTETVNLIGIRSITRRLASLFIERKYLKYFDIVLGSGSSTKNWYKECGVKSENFYSFMYSVEHPEHENKICNDRNTVKFIFVGQLIQRKGLDILINSLGEITNGKWCLDIYGSGIEEAQYRAQVNRLNLADKINFKGVISNEFLRNRLSEYNTLILPSRFDGWGAVVNEAIASGLKVICSNRCGASILLINNKIGSVFNINKMSELTTLLQENINNFKTYDRDYILNYNSYLEGQNVAEYLLDILEYHFKKKGLRPLAPWNKFIKEQKLQNTLKLTN